jgi:hypothetical protein
MREGSFHERASTREARPAVEGGDTRRVRRERTERGVYRDPTTKRYEITYTNSAGQQRWQTITGGLREARRARAEVVGR